MTFSPVLDLKNTFCLSINFFQEMTEKFGEMKCKTISFKIKFYNTFLFTSLENTIQRSEHHTAQ